MLDTANIRREIPLLRETINGHPLTYLDTAATAPMPAAVLAAMDSWERTARSNVHRGMHALAERSTEVYEAARGAVARFLHADPGEIVFTSGCTAAINLAAIGLGSQWSVGDTVVLSILEHHSNIVPWLQLQERRGIAVRWMGCDDNGNLLLHDLDAHLRTGNVRLVSVTAQSNVLGVRPDLPGIIAKAHAAGALVFVDAAQAVAHMPINVRELDADLLAFSGHKLYGPMGIGVLYAKRHVLERMPAVFGGGGMIRQVRTDGYVPADPPQRFEAGTPNVAGAVGLHAAIDWLTRSRWEDIAQHEDDLLHQVTVALQTIEGLTMLGAAHNGHSRASNAHGCCSFVVDGVHPHDLTALLGARGICLRAGHHCTMPLHDRLQANASARVSVGIFNDASDIASLITALPPVLRTLRRT